MKGRMVAAVLALGAAAIATAQTVPASAASGHVTGATSAREVTVRQCGPNTGHVCTYNGNNVLQVFSGTPHTVTHPRGPITQVYNDSKYRVWTHQHANFTGWHFCFDPFKNRYNPQPYQHPGNIQVTSNTNPCPPGSGP